MANNSASLRVTRINFGKNSTGDPITTVYVLLKHDLLDEDLSIRIELPRRSIDDSVLEATDKMFEFAENIRSALQDNGLPLEGV